MIDFFKTLYFAYKYEVPLVINDVWYNLNLYAKYSYPKVMTDDGDYIPINHKRLYPFPELSNGMTPYYRVVSHKEKPFGCYRYEGNNITCTLQLHSIK